MGLRAWWGVALAVMALAGCGDAATGPSAARDVGQDAVAPSDIPHDVYADTPLPDSSPHAADAPEADVPPDVPPRTVAPRERVASWVLLSADPAAVARNLEAAVEFGVDEVQLSHELISQLGELEDEALRHRLLEAIAAAKARGLRVLIWSNEFDDSIAVCFDPADPIWAARRATYREAFALAPELDGVVLSFGSASPPPWLAGCVCTYCLDLPSDAPPTVRPFMVPPPPERIRQVVENVHDVVTGELGRYVVVRTFIHEPTEQAWMIEGLSSVAPWRTFLQMSKDVPNDWQPYYPLNPAIGAVEGRPVILEVDAAGEYWGVSELPFPAVGYLERRVRAAQARGAIGYAARVERGGRSALGTPNEVNLAALARFFADPEASPAAVYADWLPGRYGVAPEAPALPALATIHDRAFDVGRKMLYQLGFWTLEKGSGVPAVCTSPGLLDSRANDAWDPRWAPLHARLAEPDAQVLDDLRQEDHEALALAQRNLDELDGLIGRGEVGGEAIGDLRRRLSKQRDAVAVWMEVVEGIWANVLYRRTNDPLHAGWAASASDRLEAAFAAFEGAHPGDLAPLSASDVAGCATTMRARLPADVVRVERVAASMSPPELELRDDGLHVHVETSEAAAVEVRAGVDRFELPWSAIEAEESVVHDLVVPLPADAVGWIVVKVTARGAGFELHGSDYEVRATPR